MEVSRNKCAVLKKNEIAIDFNQTFELVFDILTPRPHFIAKIRDDIKDTNNNEFKTLLELTNTELNSLLKFILNFHERLNEKNKNFILSFHIGSWGKYPKFHANLCIDLDLYLQFVEDNNFDLVEMEPTREWRIIKKDLTMKDLYIENVKNAKQVARNKTNKYKKEEIELVKKFNISENESKSFREFEYENIQLFYSIEEPVIEFYNTDSASTSNLKRYGDLLKAMIEFAKQNELFDSKKRGAHICLEVNDSKCFNGFIRTSADAYYQMNPTGDIFIKNFSKLKDYVIET